MTVGLVRYDGTVDSLRRAIELCDGFANLKPEHKVLLKPNVVIGGRKSQSPNGIVVSAALLENLITVLKEYGCKDITIGEGAAFSTDLNLNTPRAYQWAGIDVLAEKTGVKIIDFDKGAYDTVEIEGHKVQITQALKEADFVINIPALKTHQLTKITLALKNLKGVISRNSKRVFHQQDLEHFVACLGALVKVDLVVVDGSYAVQKGPVGTDVHKMDLVLAGRDMLEVDAIGALLMGIDPASVIHLADYAKMTGREVDVSSIEVRGEKVADLAKTLEWVSNWPQDLFSLYNIKGIYMETPGYSNCSGCGMGIFVAVNNFLRENKNAVFDGVEICAGREPVAHQESKKVFLLGKCAIETNKDYPGAIKVKGCPPSVNDQYEALKEELNKVTN